MKMIYKAVECTVAADKNLSVTIGDCCPEAVNYAVCRMFAHNECLRRQCAIMSYRKRLAADKAGRKPENCKCVVSACLAELEGDLLAIDFTVDCTGVTIRDIRLLNFD